MFTSELLDAHRDTLKEKESTIIELLWKVDELSATREVVFAKVAGSRQTWTMKLWSRKVRRSWSNFGGS